MNQFECLPNEILLEILRYFNARDLFHSFIHLNARFNQLIQSLPYLSLTLTKQSNSLDRISTSLIYTLKIDHTIHVDLNRFPNLHRLILLSPTSNQLKQLVFHSLPVLKHLTIGYEHFLFSSYLTDVCEKIFSNSYPNLVSCYFYEPRITEILPNLSTTNRIRRLKLDNIDFNTYKSILSLCPNLNYLSFRIIPQNEQDTQHRLIYPHLNLQRMRIKYQNLVNNHSDFIFLPYLSLVPNLIELTLNEINFDGQLIDYLQSNWFSSLISQYLHELKQLKYILYIYERKYQENKFLLELKKTFFHVHRNKYQTELLLQFS